MIKRRTGLSNPRMDGSNNLNVSGQTVSSKMLDSLTEQNVVAGLIKDGIEKINK